MWMHLRIMQQFSVAFKHPRQKSLSNPKKESIFSRLLQRQRLPRLQMKILLLASKLLKTRYSTIKLLSDSTRWGWSPAMSSVAQTIGLYARRNWRDFAQAMSPISVQILVALFSVVQMSNPLPIFSFSFIFCSALTSDFLLLNQVLYLPFLFFPSNFFQPLHPSLLDFS